MGTKLLVSGGLVVGCMVAMALAMQFGGRDAGELGLVCLLGMAMAWRFFSSILRASYNGWLYGGVAKDVLRQAKREGVL